MLPRKLYLTPLLAGIAALAVASAPLPNPAAPPSDGPYFAFLNGASEVPPVETDARGLFVGKAIAGDNAALYALLTEGLVDVAAAHIHLGGPDENGPVVAFLFDAEGVPVTQDGLLARGVLTAGDLVGPLEGMPFSALVDEIESGNAYVNVHTVENPSGEIRGQIGAGVSPQK